MKCYFFSCDVEEAFRDDLFVIVSHYFNMLHERKLICIQLSALQNLCEKFNRAIVCKGFLDEIRLKMNQFMISGINWRTSFFYYIKFNVYDFEIDLHLRIPIVYFLDTKTFNE